MSFYPNEYCYMNDHRYGPWRERHHKNATCLDCGELNGPLFSWIGQIGKRAKRNGWSWDDEAKWESMQADEWIEGIEFAGAPLVAALMARVTASRTRAEQG